MIIAMSADLARLFQFALVQSVVTLGAFDENAFGPDGTLFVLFRAFDLRFVSAKP